MHNTRAAQGTHLHAPPSVLERARATTASERVVVQLLLHTHTLTHTHTHTHAHTHSHTRTHAHMQPQATAPL
jgi:hypothetical protein